MPFKSKAQMKKFGTLVSQGKMSKATFNEWKQTTPDTSALPERVAKKPRKTKLHKVRVK